MDHLLRMKHAIYPNLEVPYLCGDMPFSAPFDTYPARLGFTTSDLVDVEQSTKADRDVDGFLQAWLFFGLLQTIFGPLFERDKFIRTNSSGQDIIFYSKAEANNGLLL